MIPFQSLRSRPPPDVAAVNREAADRLAAVADKERKLEALEHELAERRKLIERAESDLRSPGDSPAAPVIAGEDAPPLPDRYLPPDARYMVQSPEQVRAAAAAIHQAWLQATGKLDAKIDYSLENAEASFANFWKLENPSAKEIAWAIIRHRSN